MTGRGAEQYFRSVAAECGFALSGVARVEPLEAEQAGYQAWLAAGMQAGMEYLEGRRAEMRADARALLLSARSVLCVGMLYRTSDEPGEPVSRYAWGEADYHDVMRGKLRQLAQRLEQAWGRFEYRICVDTSPVLERAWARRAGLGWIGKNTCLINEETGSWYFLGALVADVDLEPGVPATERCGSCTRCIDACPTKALVPAPAGFPQEWALDARHCISYWTIEHRGLIPERLRAGIGQHVFGCDICQDVCPWNQRSPVSEEPGFARRDAGDPVRWSAWGEADFRSAFRRTPVWRAHHQGFLRNVALVLGQSDSPESHSALERLARCGDTVVEEHARWALERRE